MPSLSGHFPPDLCFYLWCAGPAEVDLEVSDVALGEEQLLFDSISLCSVVGLNWRIEGLGLRGGEGNLRLRSSATPRKVPSRP